ncbi:MAG: hypothetical protein IKN63_02475 [Bacilli bacterium]|nr:hypothetical protein [Bacilli bacterium]
MKSRFLYMKFLGLLLVVIGFSYSITSFNNFFSFIFKTSIFSENLNIFLVSLGLIMPLFTFVFGVYFYFYTDFNITKINKLIFVSYLVMMIIGIAMIIIKELYNIKNIFIFQIFEFNHISFAYCLILLSIMGIYGCFKYKY